MRNLKFVRVLMFFAAFAVALANGNAQAAEKSMVIDVSGIKSIAPYGARESNFSFDVGALARVTRLSWDITITAYEKSWLDEMEVTLYAGNRVDGYTFTPSTYQGSGTKHYSGSLDLEALGLGFNLAADGALLLEFVDLYQDYPSGYADGQWDSGSLTVGYVTAAVPEPSSYAMLLLGLFAIGAVARRRHQR